MPKPYDTLVALRKTYPTPMSNDELGALLNAVAWAHRDEGLGLFAKPNGANTCQPRTGILISRDYLVYEDGRGYDVLLDAEGRATPTWGREHDMDTTRWVAPVDESIVLPPKPPVTLPPSGAVPYVGDAVGKAIGAALFEDYAAAGRAPDADMGVWFLRAAWDAANPPHLSMEASIAKHRQQWKAVLGLPNA